MVREPLDRVVTAGAADVSNVSFFVSNASKVLDQAREAVIADARCNAEIYAKAAGMGRMDHGGYRQWSPVPMLARAQAAPPVIASGKDRLCAKVAVGFETARVSRSGG